MFISIHRNSEKIATATLTIQDAVLKPEVDMKAMEGGIALMNTALEEAVTNHIR